MRPQLTNLQALRAIAAICVLVFHSTLTAEDYFGASQYFSVLGFWGASGVDMFFVLSGFVMVYSQFGRNFRPNAFLLGRVVRIVPLYFTLTALVVALVAFVPSIIRSLTISGPEILASFTFTSTLVLDQRPLLLYGWTLEYEFLFYLIFAAALVLANAARGDDDQGRRTLFLVLFSAVCCVLPFVTHVDLVFWEFLFGVAVGLIVVTGQRDAKALWRPVLFIGLAGWIGALFWSDFYARTELQDWRVLAWGLPAMFVIWGAAMAPQIDNAAIRYFGAASYAIYLVQILSVPASMKVLAKLAPDISSDVAALLSILLGLTAGSDLHTLYENPITGILKRLLKRRASQPMASAQNVGGS